MHIEFLLSTHTLYFSLYSDVPSTFKKNTIKDHVLLAVIDVINRVCVRIMSKNFVYVILWHNYYITMFGGTLNYY